MTRARLAAFALIVAVVSPASGWADDAPRLGTLVSAKPIERRNPDYPTDAAWAMKEGWVTVSFCVDATGTVQNAVIELSSGVREFERAALQAIPRWRYEPARLDGVPVEQCDNNVRLSFSLAGMPLGARPQFAQKWRTASQLIGDAKLAEAKVILEDLQAQNNYEGARLALARSQIAQSTGDEREQLKQLRLALVAPQALEKELRAKVARQVFALELRQHEWASAWASYQSLAVDESALGDAERAAGERLDAMIHGGSVFVTSARLECRCHPTNGVPLWSAELMRREFGFADPAGGAIDHFELRCLGHRFTARFETNKSWRVPEAWGKCTLYAFGEEGATFRLLEYPPDAAAPSAPPPAPNP